MIDKNKFPEITKLIYDDNTEYKAEEYEEQDYSNIKLEKGEIVCPDCKGKGFFDNPKILDRVVNSDEKLNPITYIPSSKRYPCMKCKGHRKVDWVENLTGGKEGDAILPEIRVTLDYIRNSLEKVLYNSYKTDETIHNVQSNIIDLLESLKQRDGISDYHVSNNDFDKTISVDVRCDNTINHIAFKIQTNT